MRKEKSALEKIKKAKIKVKIPKEKETEKSRPLQIIPFMRVKETRIGTAKVDSKELPYVKTKGETTIRDLLRPSVVEEDIVEFEKKIKKKQ